MATRYSVLTESSGPCSQATSGSAAKMPETDLTLLTVLSQLRLEWMSANPTHQITQTLVKQLQEPHNMLSQANVLYVDRTILWQH